ncbi:MAG: ATP-binding protein, partial [Pseudomonadota bacterium]|nr:ATP-binding protein [Pseudomonadota bacterium]
GQLTGGIAHDFNNLLMAISSSLALLQKRIPDDPALRRLIDNALQGTQRGAALTQRMLAFARRQELAPVPVDVPALLQGMADLLERSLGPAIDFVCKFETELPPVLIDPNQLELAILNLAVNARDAMPAGGRVVIEGRSAEGVQRPGRFVCIAVSDNGQGMDESTRNRAVEPFFTTKGAGKGTGLGLAMVHGVAAQSGGELVLRSVLGVGTTAEIWLPVASGEVRGRVDQRRRKSRPAGACRSLVVLAVDDDNLVLEGTVAMLEEIGHQAIGASSALEALSLVRARPDIEVVVTDEVMPGMRGSELVEVLAAERPALAVIVASGFAQIGSTSIGTARGLNKPFDQDALGEAIAGAMTRTV